MEFSVLASGSKGNLSYIASCSCKILIDAGISSILIEKNLNNLGVNPNEINGILLTHTHTDHINGLKIFIKKYNTKLYLSKKMYNELIKQLPIVNYEIIDKEIEINDINIDIIKLSHDAEDSNGYIFTSDNKSIAYITDTGYINKKNHNKLINRNAYIMESNHDVEKLMNGKYPYYLKQRILGDKGHLSNKASSEYLSNFLGDNTESIVLIHLSEENNDPGIALKTLEDTLKSKDIEFNNIIISSQKERTDLIIL